jgi:hypothetical protein
MPGLQEESADLLHTKIISTFQDPINGEPLLSAHHWTCKLSNCAKRSAR